ncbi:hypothetical protein J2W49_003394 [Hydrogenophaga palleronii]|uniref:Uncharacterized protein n=1 Tax=Hydrogenophaga palleronii TaxID=65655 RepID=A0ABU1WQ48_9BURK|nr:hypothetical protein [Hydrogenophaga palleronii]
MVKRASTIQSLSHGLRASAAMVLLPGRSCRIGFLSFVDAIPAPKGGRDEQPIKR